MKSFNKKLMIAKLQDKNLLDKISKLNDMTETLKHSILTRINVTCE